MGWIVVPADEDEPPIDHWQCATCDGPITDDYLSKNHPLEGVSSEEPADD